MLAPLIFFNDEGETVIQYLGSLFSCSRRGTDTLNRPVSSVRSKQDKETLQRPMHRNVKIAVADGKIRVKRGRF